MYVVFAEEGLICMLESIIEFILRIFYDAEDCRHRKEMPEIERIEEENRGFDPKKRDALSRILLISSAVLFVIVMLIAIITK
jgi:hypothetical protein